MNRYTPVPLADVIQQNKDYIAAPEQKVYPKLSVKLYGKGVVLDTPVDGAVLKMKKHQLAKPGQVILSEIWGKKGAIGFVPDEGEGALCTSHFFLFDVDSSKIDRRWLAWMFKGNFLESQLSEHAFGTTGYAAVRPKNLLAATIPLPTLDEQHRIVAKIESLAAKIDEAKQLRQAIRTDAQAMLRSAFQQIIEGAEYRPMREVAPIVRRPVEIEPAGEYPELGVRSFGKGTFHKPMLIGVELDWQKFYRVHAGDLVVSNIKAWEGAISVVGEDDHERVGSHRYITCVPQKGVTTAGFLSFYLLTDEGIEQVQVASPGSADRNRTLAMKRLEKIEVPIPPYEKQLRFSRLQAQAAAIGQAQADNQTELDALLPAILDRAFKGEL